VNRNPKGGSIVVESGRIENEASTVVGSPADTVRIIPCLDMKDGRVVKGVHFEGLRDAGDPVENAAYYQQEGADQLAMLDIAATVENRKTRVEWAKQVASVIQIPLVVGGGISTLADMDALFDVGVTAVSVNSAAVARPELVKEASDRFGAGRVLVAIDGRRNEAMPSGFEVVVSGGQKPVGMDAVEWARACEALGAGELLPTSMDGDGTLAGYDLPFTRSIAEAVKIPVIASGGAGELQHFYDGVVEGKASALLAASVFHFRTFTVRQVKEYLAARGIRVLL
jgi:cyclase